jgi:hypothetical protein
VSNPQDQPSYCFYVHFLGDKCGWATRKSVALTDVR